MRRFRCALADDVFVTATDRRGNPLVITRCGVVVGYVHEPTEVNRDSVLRAIRAERARFWHGAQLELAAGAS